MTGLYVIQRPIFPDERGFFREVFRLDKLKPATGMNFKPVQMNHSRSLPRVIRAFHAENWNKLVYPVNGEIFVSIVDIRPESPTFAQHEEFRLNDQNRLALFISSGLANSICVTGSSPVDYVYLVDAYYDGKDTRAVAWDDPDLAIPWPVKDPIISDRDNANPSLRSLFPSKFTKIKS